MRLCWIPCSEHEADSELSQNSKSSSTYEAAAKESGNPFLEPSEHHLKIAVVLAESGSGDSNLYPSME